MFEVMGVIGTILAAIAYVPQITALLRTRSAKDISVRTWQVWFVSAVLIMTNAVRSDDIMFKTLSISNVTFITITLILITTYRRVPRAILPKCDPPDTSTTGMRRRSPLFGGVFWFAGAFPLRHPAVPASSLRKRTRDLFRRLRRDRCPSTETEDPALPDPMSDWRWESPKE